MPARAASEQPIAHASSDDRSGRAPLSMASGRSSTTARMVMPVRVRYSRSAQTDGDDDGEHERQQLVPRHVRRRGSRRCCPSEEAVERAGLRRAATARCRAPRAGGQQGDRHDEPRRLAARRSRPRMTTRSITAPNAVPARSRTSADGHARRARPSRAAASRRTPPSIPIAPWAKLKMPVVVYVRTRPLAAMAKMPAVHRPVIGGGEELVHELRSLSPPGTSTTLSASQLKMPVVRRR